MRTLFIFLSFLLFSSVSFAQLTVTDIDYASNFDRNDDGTISKIYGGIAGDLTNCTGTLDATTFCNSCVAQNEACNRLRIHNTLQLVIRFTVDVEFTGVISAGTNTGTYSAITLADSTPGSLSKGSSGFIKIAWGTICTLVASVNCEATGGSISLILGLATNSTTEPDAANRITIPIDVTIPNAGAVPHGYDFVHCDDPSPGTGICTLLAFPGDKKVYVDKLQEVGSWPQSNSVPLKFLRVYYSTASFADASYKLTDTNGFADFDLDSDGVPTSDIIENLENDIQYYFRPGVVDQAMNEAFLSDVDEIDGTTDNIAGTGCATNTDANCDLIATPSEVVGLLTEDLNCFVSTAAYGSSLSKEVQTFRRFRNKFLLRSKYGKKLNSFYYRYGPIAARFISDNSYLKPMARTALWPMAYLAEKSNRHGLHIFILGLFGMGLLLSASFIIGGRLLWRKI